jgi:hypothetical protein
MGLGEPKPLGAIIGVIDDKAVRSQTTDQCLGNARFVFDDQNSQGCELRSTSLQQAERT